MFKQIDTVANPRECATAYGSTYGWERIVGYVNCTYWIPVVYYDLVCMKCALALRVRYRGMWENVYEYNSMRTLSSVVTDSIAKLCRRLDPATVLVNYNYQ